MPWSLVTALLLTGGLDLDAEPPLVPSGMDLLYDDRVAFAPHGEPMVTIGLMEGQTTVTVRAVGTAQVQVDFYDARAEGVLKRATIPSTVAITATLGRSEPAKQRHYVDLDGVAWVERDKLDWALAGWRARGYPEVEALEEGTVLGIGGRVLDNRTYRIALPTADRATAERVATEAYRRFGQRAMARARLVERPWGEISVKTSRGPLGTATSYVRLVPVPTGDEPAYLEVKRVEHGRGYDWHGFADRRYAGELYVAIDPGGKLAVVNAVGAETVLKGVVPAEIFAVAPVEALAAQAVAARNHLLAQLGRRHHGDPYHLCAEQHCQVYAGIEREDPRTTAAVDTTYGRALFHDGALVHAVYSSTCGGFTEDNDAVWGNHPDPALRARPDFDPVAHPELAPFNAGLTDENVAAWVARTPATFCSTASFARGHKFRWQKRLSAAELARLLAPRYPSLGRLSDLRVRERGRGGKVVSLELVGDTGTATVVTELPIRRLFGNLNSGAFVVEAERDAKGALNAVTFRGGGWGHGVGMCQLGAIGRAEAGQDAATILGYYYNGAQLQRLYDPPPPRAPTIAPAPQ